MQPYSPHAPSSCASSHCSDCDVCGDQVELHIVAADYGLGAFLAVLCKECEHRREYRTQLELRRRRRAVAPGNG